MVRVASLLRVTVRVGAVLSSVMAWVCTVWLPAVSVAVTRTV